MITEDIKHVFFDAEGTLYIPKNGHTYQEFWTEPSLERAKKMFKLDRNIHDILKTLKEKGVRIYIISKHEEKILIGLLVFFKIKHLFDEILINGDKGKRIKLYAKNKEIPLKTCIMIGDNYNIDFLPMKREGIQCYLVNRSYNKQYKTPRLRTIEDIVDLA